MDQKYSDFRKQYIPPINKNKTFVAKQDQSTDQFKEFSDIMEKLDQSTLKTNSIPLTSSLNFSEPKILNLPSDELNINIDRRFRESKMKIPRSHSAKQMTNKMTRTNSNPLIENKKQKSVDKCGSESSKKTETVNFYQYNNNTVHVFRSDIPKESQNPSFLSLNSDVSISKPQLDSMIQREMMKHKNDKKKLMKQGVEKEKEKPKKMTDQYSIIGKKKLQSRINEVLTNYLTYKLINTNLPFLRIENYNNEFVAQFQIQTDSNNYQTKLSSYLELDHNVYSKLLKEQLLKIKREKLLSDINVSRLQVILQNINTNIFINDKQNHLKFLDSPRKIRKSQRQWDKQLNENQLLNE